MSLALIPRRSSSQGSRTTRPRRTSESKRRVRPLGESLTSAARRRTGLHTGEVITAINGRPTRDLFEFIRVLGSYSAGQSVTLTTRRGIKFSEVQVELLER